MSDLLCIEYINSLPQPFMAHFYGGSKWPIYDIDVETGLLRIDVCGKLQISHIMEVKLIMDMNGDKHASETFYLENIR